MELPQLALKRIPLVACASHTIDINGPFLLRAMDGLADTDAMLCATPFHFMILPWSLLAGPPDSTCTPAIFRAE